VDTEVSGFQATTLPFALPCACFIEKNLQQNVCRQSQVDNGRSLCLAQEWDMSFISLKMVRI
jgi:hypothetical protein